MKKLIFPLLLLPMFSIGQMVTKRSDVKIDFVGNDTVPIMILYTIGESFKSSRHLNGYEVRATGPYFKIGGRGESVTIDNVTYLDGRKRPLPKNYVVWITKPRTD